MLLSALFVIAKIWEQSKWPSETGLTNYGIPYNGILLSSKKELTLEIHNLGESQNDLLC